MYIKAGNITDAALIHQLMIKAYKEYENKQPSSSALDETVSSIRNSLEKTEQAFIAFDEETPVGMVRFQANEEQLYFYRLSVIPEQQGRGIAKQLLQKLEDYAKYNNIATLACKVRKSMPRNVHLYHSLGYEIIEEEILPLSNANYLEVFKMQKNVALLSK